MSVGRLVSGGGLAAWGPAGVDLLINPVLLFSLIALGGVGVALAMPRRPGQPQILGAILAAVAFGGIVLALSLRAGLEQIPNLYFYVFAPVALGAAIRVITHPKPVYAALYFILTIIATAGLFLILSAEFMAFALVIVYAGAILITYLFVIMLATQAPSEGEVEVLTDYDTVSREPAWAAAVGFVLLAALTTLMFRGVTEQAPGTVSRSETLLAEMPRKVERILAGHGMLNTDAGERVMAINPREGVILVSRSEGTQSIPRDQWPEELDVGNVEAVGFNLLRDHPGTIEIAGVILLMAMLGAVVLSRKQVQLDEEAKMRQARLLASQGELEKGGQA